MDDVISKGRKVVLRKKRNEDTEDDHRWRQDPELAELDATAVLRQSLQDFTRDYEQEIRYPTPWVKRYGIDAIDENGCVEPPQGPGMGVQFDWESINAHRTDTVVYE